MKLQFLILPMSCALVFAPYSAALSAVRVSNSSARVTNSNYYNNYSSGMQNMPTAMPSQQVSEPAPTVTEPVNTELESCSMIYPNGVFEIGRPTVGMAMGGPRQCVSVVELRGYHMGQDGEDLVLARAKLAAGDTFKCNISDFPEADYTAAAGTITFPADAEPTVADVTKVMNQEQKENAGLKIAAAAVIGGLGGNVFGKNDIGKDGIIGTDKGKLAGTAVGGLSFAALMAASVYSGKVAGDVVLSTGVNMVAGGMVGNIAASGDSVMRIENCTLDGESGHKCLWGVYIETKDLDGRKDYYYNFNTHNTMVCDGGKIINCSSSGQLMNIKLDNMNKYTQTNGNKKDTYNYVSDLTREQVTAYAVGEIKNAKCLSTTDATKPDCSDEEKYYKIASAKIAQGLAKPVMIDMDDVSNKAFGWQKSDWSELKGKIDTNKIYNRAADGSGKEPQDTYKIEYFNPVYQDAESGGVVDLGNRARLKSTLIGAGAGGALGGFAAYQGAQDEINERWVSAVRDYKDSLQKVYCATGTRFLSYYNDTVFIPKPQVSEPE